MATNYRDELDELSRRKLERLLEPPLRNAASASRARAKFMAQVRQMPADRSVKSGFFWWLPGKRQQGPAIRPLAMRPQRRLTISRLAISLLEILLILFSSSIFTVFAAQDSLPSDSIYPVKLLSEDVRLGLTSSQVIKIDLALALTDRRIEEIVALQANGQQVTPPVIERMEEHYLLALETASTMPDLQMSEMLLEVQGTTENQLVTMSSLVETAPAESEDELKQAQQVLQDNENLAKDGLKDPEKFREKMQNKSKGNDAPGSSGSGGSSGSKGSPQNGSRNSRPGGRGAN